MKRALLCLFLLLLTSPADAVVAGNPDQRPSLLLGFGYGWGTASLYEVVTGAGVAQHRFVDNSDYSRRQYGGLLTLPTSRSLSFMLGFSLQDEPPPNDSMVGDFYVTDKLNTASIGVRFYLP